MTRLITMAAVLLFAAPAAAEGQLLEAQKQLNAESARAAQAEEYDKAALLLRSSLELGELNITWLNLGRVLFKGGRCLEARDAYKKALTAPEAPNPPPVVVQRTAAEFLAELSTACPGTLALECPLSYEVYIDGEPAQCGAKAELPAGPHTVRARHEGWEVTRTVDVTGVELTTLSVDVRTGALVPEPEPFRPPEPVPAASPNYLGWSLVGAGTILLATGGLYRWSYQDDIDEIRAISRTDGGSRARYDDLTRRIESGDAVVVTAFALGLALAATGVGVIWFRGPPEAGIQVRVVPTGVFVSY